jgi:hypothetical protein
MVLRVGTVGFAALVKLLYLWNFESQVSFFVSGLREIALRRAAWS